MYGITDVFLINKFNSFFMLFYSNVIAQAAEPIVTKKLHTNIGALEHPEQLLTQLGAFSLTFLVKLIALEK